MSKKAQGFRQLKVTAPHSITVRFPISVTASVITVPLPPDVCLLVVLCPQDLAFRLAHCGPVSVYLAMFYILVLLLPVFFAMYFFVQLLKEQRIIPKKSFCGRQRHKSQARLWLG